jgi:hypothetical protein
MNNTFSARLCVALICTIFLVAPEARSQSAKTAENSMEELAFRLLDNSRFELSSAEPKLLVGKIPEPIVSEIDVLEGARVIGSLVHETESKIVLNTNASPEEVISKYEALLTARDWNALQMEGEVQRAGFLPSEANMNYRKYFRIFCREKGGASMTIRAKLRQDKTTDLFLAYSHGGDNSPCNRMAGGMRGRLRGLRSQPSEYNLIPALYAPEGAGSQQMGGGGGPYSTNQFVTLKTNLSVSELLSHYGKQLEKAGWQPLAQNSGENFAGQHWRFKDNLKNDWHALLLITALPEEKEQRSIILYVYQKDQLIRSTK